MDLGNLVETIVHHLEVRGMAGLDHWDRVPIVSALVCTITYWINTFCDLWHKAID